MDAHSKLSYKKRIYGGYNYFPNLRINVDKLKGLPIFYKNIVENWIEISSSEPLTNSMILSESLWYNEFIKIDSLSISPSFFNVSESVFLWNLFDSTGNFISWQNFAQNFNLKQQFYFKFVQIRNSIPRSWISKLKNVMTSESICHFAPHLNIKARIVTLEKLSSSQFYKIFI